MANPYLSQDESVILATDKVLFKSVSLSAMVLTNKRILLIQSVGDTLSADEILLVKLRSAKIDEKATEDPQISLSYITPAGDKRQETLTFTRQPGKQRNEECGEWAKKLNEQIAPSPAEEPPVQEPPAPQTAAPAPAAEPVPAAAPAGQAPATADEGPVSPEMAGDLLTTASPNEILAKHGRLSGLTFPEIPPVVAEPEVPAPEPRKKLILVATLALILIVIIAGAFLVMQGMQSQPSKGIPAAVTAAPPVTSNIMTSAPIPVTNTPAPVSPVPQETPSPAITESSSVPEVPVPETGVWVRVQYPGNFTGSIGKGAGFQSISGTGDSLYQVWTINDFIKAIIQKGDGTGRTLTVDIYKDGVSIQHSSTTKPKGEVALQIDLRTINSTATKPAVTTPAAINKTSTP